MFDVVDLSTASAPVTAGARARAAAVYAARRTPKSVICVPRPQIEEIAAGLTGGYVIPRVNQRWWACPCGTEVGDPCPHAVLYGRVEDRSLIAVMPASYFDVPADRVAPVILVVDRVEDIDAVIRGLDQAGQSGLATMLLAWLELGLRDALTVALADRASA